MSIDSLDPTESYPQIREPHHRTNVLKIGGDGPRADSLVAASCGLYPAAYTVMRWAHG